MSIVKVIEAKIITIKNLQVIIDRDVADIYGVSTKRINEAVKNNPEKFPDGYVISLTQEEKTEVVENFDHLIQLKYSPTIPKAFSEKGLYMLATILKSPIAAQTTIAIIETFAKIRELGRNVQQISSTTDDCVKQTLLQKGGELINEIIDDHLAISETESSVEINFAVLKIKHTIKRERSVTPLNKV